MEWKMIIGEKYEIAHVVAQGEGFRTFDAREISTGRALLAHQLLETAAGGQSPSLRDLARRCNPGSGGIVCRCSSGEMEFVVTEAGEAFRDLRAALEKAALLPPPAAKESLEDRFTRVGAWRVPSSLTSSPAPPAPPASAASGIFSTPSAGQSSVQPDATDEFSKMFGSSEPSVPPVEPAAVIPDRPAPVEAEHGEFTRMFQAPVSAGAPTPAPPSATPPGGVTQAFQAPAATEPVLTQPPPVSSEPGDFTRMFQAPVRADAPAPAPPPATPPSGVTQAFQAPAPIGSSPAPPPSASREPGDFTRMFQAASPPSQGRQAAPSLPHSEPGDFTRMFKAPGAAQPASPPQQPPAGKPGEFTQFFQSSLASGPFEEPKTPAPQRGPVAPPPTPAAQPGEYTRLFQMPSQQPAPPSAGSGATGAFVMPSAPMPPSSPSVEEGPSDFTRIIRSSTPAASEVKPAEAPGAAARAPAARKPGVPIVLVVVLSALGVLAVGMILFFALRH